MEKDTITKTVNSFKTKHKEGFIDSEIKLLLKQFTKLHYQHFNEVLGTVTCMYINEESVIYKQDVIKAINSCIENCDLNFEDWD